MEEGGVQGDSQVSAWDGWMAKWVGWLRMTHWSLDPRRRAGCLGETEVCVWALGLGGVFGSSCDQRETWRAELEAVGWAALLQVEFSAGSQERVEDRKSGEGREKES